MWKSKNNLVDRNLLTLKFSVLRIVRGLLSDILVWRDLPNTVEIHSGVANKVSGERG